MHKAIFLDISSIFINYLITEKNMLMNIRQFLLYDINVKGVLNPWLLNKPTTIVCAQSKFVPIYISEKYGVENYNVVEKRQLPFSRHLFWIHKQPRAK